MLKEGGGGGWALTRYFTVEARFGVYAEYVALGRVKSHAPVVCPSLQQSQIVLEGVVVPEGVYLPIYEAIISKEPNIGSDTVGEIVDV